MASQPSSTPSNPSTPSTHLLLKDQYNYITNISTSLHKAVLRCTTESDGTPPLLGIPRVGNPSITPGGSHFVINNQRVSAIISKLREAVADVEKRIPDQDSHRTPENNHLPRRGWAFCCKHLRKCLRVAKILRELEDVEEEIGEATCASGMEMPLRERAMVMKKLENVKLVESIDLETETVVKTVTDHGGAPKDPEMPKPNGVVLSEPDGMLVGIVAELTLGQLWEINRAKELDVTAQVRG